MILVTVPVCTGRQKKTKWIHAKKIQCDLTYSTLEQQIHNEDIYEGEKSRVKKTISHMKQTN